MLFNQQTSKTAQSIEQYTGGYGRTDNTGNIRAHSVHQQEVMGIRLLTDFVGDTRRHRHSRHTGRKPNKNVILLNAMNSLLFLSSQNYGIVRMDMM